MDIRSWIKNSLKMNTISSVRIQERYTKPNIKNKGHKNWVKFQQKKKGWLSEAISKELSNK